MMFLVSHARRIKFVWISYNVLGSNCMYLDCTTWLLNVLSCVFINGDSKIDDHDESAFFVIIYF